MDNENLLVILDVLGNDIKTLRKSAKSSKIEQKSVVEKKKSNSSTKPQPKKKV